ncbi:hypothetical protein, partial [Aquimarina spinulae]
MISEEEIEKIISDFRPKEGEYKCYRYVKDGVLFFNFSPEDVDDREAQAGGGDNRGFPTIRLSTGEIEYIHYLDFPLELFDQIPKPNCELIISKIKKRKFINLGDIYNFSLDKFGEDNPEDVIYYK